MPAARVTHTVRALPLALDPTLAFRWRFPPQILHTRAEGQSGNEQYRALMLVHRTALMRHHTCSSLAAGAFSGFSPHPVPCAGLSGPRLPTSRQNRQPNLRFRQNRQPPSRPTHQNLDFRQKRQPILRFRQKRQPRQLQRASAAESATAFPCAASKCEIPAESAMLLSSSHPPIPLSLPHAVRFNISDSGRIGNRPIPSPHTQKGRPRPRSSPESPLWIPWISCRRVSAPAPPRASAHAASAAACAGAPSAASPPPARPR